MRAKVILVALSLWGWIGLGEGDGQVPRDCDQLVVAVSEGWDGTTGRMMRFERGKRGWEPVGASVNVLFGRNGLAWGRGVHRVPPGAPGVTKREGDGRAPAGCFVIPKVYGYDGALPAGAKFPYRQVGPWDAWSDDPASPYYNRHMVVDPSRGVPAWFEKAKMRHGDFAYRWLVEIRHNADPPVPGAGSAIFFHIRRGPDRKTAGCTTMAENDLVTMIRWLREKENPHYVLLPRRDYELLRGAWDLPAIP
ncbi:MAG: L,D-transpeptidase family protein [Verrucomicrobiota bacterium]